MRWAGILIVVLLLTGCRTRQMIVERTQYVHDTAFVSRDSVVYRLVRDSVTEREKTALFVKNDTVYSVTDRWHTRVVSNTDTVQVVKYVYRVQDETKTETVKEQKKETHRARWLWAVVGVLALLLLTGYFIRR